MRSPEPIRQSFLTSLLAWADKPADNPTRLKNLIHSLVRVILISFSEIKKNDIALRSGALTYTVLLSLVPILAMSTAVVKGLGGGEELKAVAYTYIDSLSGTSSSINDLFGSDVEENSSQEPDSSVTEISSMTGHLRSAADKLFAYVDQTNFATIGTVGVLGIFVSVILVLSNIEMAMNSIWHVEDSRSLMRKVFDYLALMVLIPISIIVTFAASAFLKVPVLATKFQLLIPFAWLQTLLLKLVPVFFIAVTFYAIYIFFPNTRVKNKPALIGSVLAAMLWFGVQNVYVSLQVGVSNYNAIYGSLATLPIFLVWMYLGWIFILGGAQVAYACQHLTSYRLVQPQSIPAARLSAAFDIVNFVQDGFVQARKVSEGDIIDSHAEYDPLVLYEVLEQLVAAELLHISATSGGYLPAAPPERLDHSRIIHSILGDEVPDTPGGKASLKVLHAAAHSTDSESPDSPSAESHVNLQEGQSST